MSARGTAVDACERALRRGIVRGDFPAGERLPPERQLAERLGVNRTTLRGALSRLASAQLVTVRQGSGYEVQDVRRVAGMSALPDIVALRAERGEPTIALYRDLLEVRRRLARMVFERIAERRDPALADRVAAAVDAFEAVVGDPSADTLAIAEADLAVTAAMLEGTGSTVLALCLNPISQVLERLGPLRDAMYARPMENVLAYRQALVWLRDPRPQTVGPVVALIEARDRANLRTIEEAEAEMGSAGPA